MHKTEQSRQRISVIMRRLNSRFSIQSTALTLVQIVHKYQTLIEIRDLSSRFFRDFTVVIFKIPAYFLFISHSTDLWVFFFLQLTTAAIKDYNRGRAYLIDLAKRQGVPVFNDLKQTMECAVEKAKTCNSRNSI